MNDDFTHTVIHTAIDDEKCDNCTVYVGECCSFHEILSLSGIYAIEHTAQTILWIDRAEL